MGHLGFVAVFDSVENPDKGQLVIKIAEFDFSSGNSAAFFWLVLAGYALNSIVYCKSGAGEFAASKVFSPRCLKRDFAFLCEVFFRNSSIRMVSVSRSYIPRRNSSVDSL